MRHLLIGLGTLAALTFSACKDKPDTPETLTPPTAQLDQPVTPLHYQLSFDIDPRQDDFTGTTRIKLQIDKKIDGFWLHGKGLQVAEATLEAGDKEIAASYSQEGDWGIARITLDEAVPAGIYTLEIDYFAPFNRNLDSLYKVEQGGESYVVTQMEAVSARGAFPSFDEPRFKVPFDVTITAREGDVVIANTPEIAIEPSGEGWVTHTFETTRPLPTYLIAMAVGPYDLVEWEPLRPNAVRMDDVPLRAIAAKGKGDQLEYALENTQGILEALESYFGIPYPYGKLDLIAAPDYAYGAMENPGAIVYREYLLLLDENAPLAQRRGYASVHGHELAHQWFGNLVTPVWWDDIWLNEAFATWMGNKAAATWNPDGEFDRNTLRAALGAMGTDSLANARRIREPVTHDDSVMNAFDSITYRKGGGVLAMFESYLGENRFREGVRLHMERYEDGVATADDFFKSLADGSGEPKLVEALKSFVDQPGLPLVSATLDCSGEMPAVDLTQSRYAPLGSTIAQGNRWDIPVCVAYGSGDERDKTCTLMTTQSTRMELYNDRCPDWILPNADGAGYYRFTMSDEAFSAVIDNLDHLNAREALVLSDSLRAGLRAGTVSAEAYLDGAEELARRPEWDVSLSAGQGLGQIYADILPESAKSDMSALMRRMYKRRYQNLVNLPPEEAAREQGTLAGRLVFYGGDRALSRDLAEAGARYIGLNGEPDSAALDPNVRWAALAVLARDRGEEAYPTLLDLASNSPNPGLQGAALEALSNVSDPDLISDLHEVLLTDTLTGRQALSVVYGLMGNPAAKDMTWDWFQTNFDQFVTRVPAAYLRNLPGMVGFFCDADAAEAVAAFFESKAGQIPGYERSLALNLESAQLCAALKAEKGDELAAALAER